MTYLLIYSSNNSTYRCILIVLTVCYQDVYFQEKLQPITYDLQPMKMTVAMAIFQNTFLEIRKNVIDVECKEFVQNFQSLYHLIQSTLLPKGY